MAVTTGSFLQPAIQKFFNMKLLSTPTPNNIHGVAAERYNKPRNTGKYIDFRRYNPIEPDLVPLGESGATPPPVMSGVSDVQARINWYGQYILLNEQAVLNNQESVLNAYAIRLGVAMRQTEDELLRNLLVSSASAIDCVNGMNGDTPTNVTDADINVVVEALLGADAQMFTAAIPGEDRVSTAPVFAAYIAMCHTDLTSDFRGLSKFQNVANYPDPKSIMDGEWGTIGNVRVLVSSIGSKVPNGSGLGRTLYNIPIVAQESYACIEQDGASAEFLYVPAIYNDPLAQNVSLGWKSANAQALLNESWCAVLRCTRLAL